uniref:Uncharacterized protein n=1 Tax=Romanomermis culicivorax TaxID=13658 RepID=A0A915I0H2_ROMCU
MSQINLEQKNKRKCGYETDLEEGLKFKVTVSELPWLRKQSQKYFLAEKINFIVANYTESPENECSMARKQGP